MVKRRWTCRRLREDCSRYRYFRGDAGISNLEDRAVLVWCAPLAALSHLEVIIFPFEIVVLGAMLVKKFSG